MEFMILDFEGNSNISVTIKQGRYNKDILVLKDNHSFYVPWLLNVHLCRGDFPRGKSCCFVRLRRTWLGFLERREWRGLISASNSRKKRTIVTRLYMLIEIRDGTFICFEFRNDTAYPQLRTFDLRLSSGACKSLIRSFRNFPNRKFSFSKESDGSAEWSFTIRQLLKFVSKMVGFPNKWFKKAKLLFRWRRLGAPS